MSLIIGVSQCSLLFDPVRLMRDGFILGDAISLMRVFQAPVILAKRCVELRRCIVIFWLVVVFLYVWFKRPIGREFRAIFVHRCSRFSELSLQGIGADQMRPTEPRCGSHIDGFFQPKNG